MSDKKKFLEKIPTLIYPTRYQIFNIIENSGKPMNAAQIAKKLKLDINIVSFHLSFLEKHEFVNSHFGFVNPHRDRTRAAKYYEPTEKGRLIVKKILEQLKKE